MTIYFYGADEVPYGCFFNFSAHGFELDGRWWPTSEHYFQAQKFAGTRHADLVRRAGTPLRAAQLGRDRSRPLRREWDRVKDDVMRRAVTAKFAVHADIRVVLLGAGDEEIVEPPVPPGLATPSGPLQGLADFLRLDADLLAVAAEASAPVTRRTPPTAALAAVKQLPRADKTTSSCGCSTATAHICVPNCCADSGEEDRAPVGGGRTVGQLLAGAEQRWTARQRAADKRKAAERARREKAAEAARQQRLDAIAANPEQAWQYVGTLIANKKPKDYDTAVMLLTDLQAIADRDNQGNAFNERMQQLREEHARKPSLIDRLDRAGVS